MLKSHGRTAPSSWHMHTHCTAFEDVAHTLKRATPSTISWGSARSMACSTAPSVSQYIILCVCKPTIMQASGHPLLRSVNRVEQNMVHHILGIGTKKICTLKAGQKPVVRTVTERSRGEDLLFERCQDSKACCFSRASCRSVTMPSICNWTENSLAVSMWMYIYATLR